MSCWPCSLVGDTVAAQHCGRCDCCRPMTGTGNTPPWATVCPVCSYGEPARHTCNPGQAARHDILARDERAC